DNDSRERVYRYFNNPPESMPWMLIRQAMASPARTAIVPWQDYLGLDGSHRMNTPGTTQGNWQWRFTWDQVPRNIAGRIHDLVTTYDRLPVADSHVTRNCVGYGLADDTEFQAQGIGALLP
ncbi:MAG TPA: 4-alpha-glucanotransferase, partial [Halioglobus sp.]